MPASMVPVRGTRLYVEDSGEQDLPPIVALHSLFLEGRMFDGFVSAPISPKEVADGGH